MNSGREEPRLDLDAPVTALRADGKSWKSSTTGVGKNRDLDSMNTKYK